MWCIQSSEQVSGDISNSINPSNVIHGRAQGHTPRRRFQPLHTLVRARSSSTNLISKPEPGGTSNTQCLRTTAVAAYVHHSSVDKPPSFAGHVVRSHVAVIVRYAPHGRIRIVICDRSSIPVVVLPLHLVGGQEKGVRLLAGYGHYGKFHWEGGGFRHQHEVYPWQMSCCLSHLNALVEQDVRVVIAVVANRRHVSPLPHSADACQSFFVPQAGELLESQPHDRTNTC